MPLPTSEQLSQMSREQLVELAKLYLEFKAKLRAAGGSLMPASAVKAMTDVVDDKLMADIVKDMRHGRSAPSGLIPDESVSKPVVRGSGWQSSRPLEPPPGVKHVDQIAEHFAALDKLEMVRRFSGK